MSDATNSCTQIYADVHDQCYSRSIVSLQVIRIVEHRVYWVVDNAADAAIFNAIYSALSETRTRLVGVTHAE